MNTLQLVTAGWIASVVGLMIIFNNTGYECHTDLKSDPLLMVTDSPGKLYIQRTDGKRLSGSIITCE